MHRDDRTLVRNRLLVHSNDDLMMDWFYGRLIRSTAFFPRTQILAIATREYGANGRVCNSVPLSASQNWMSMKFFTVLAMDSTVAGGHTLWFISDLVVDVVQFIYVTKMMDERTAVLWEGNQINTECTVIRDVICVLSVLLLFPCLQQQERVLFYRWKRGNVDSSQNCRCAITKICYGRTTLASPGSIPVDGQTRPKVCVQIESFTLSQDSSFWFKQSTGCRDVMKTFITIIINLYVLYSTPILLP